MQSSVLHRDFFCAHGAERCAVTSAHAELSAMQGCLSEIKAQSRGNKLLLLLLASATEITEQNKQANEVTTLCFFWIS